MFHFQGIERLILSKLAPFMYLWMIDILMVIRTPRNGVGSRNRTKFWITKCFILNG